MLSKKVNKNSKPFIQTLVALSLSYFQYSRSISGLQIEKPDLLTVHKNWNPRLVINPQHQGAIYSEIVYTGIF